MQMRAKKKEEVMNKKRNLGGRDAPPHLVAVIPLHHDVNVNELLLKIQNLSNEEDATLHNSNLPTSGFSINITRLKHRFTFITPTSTSLPDILDCGLIADTVLFMLCLDSENPIDFQGQMFLSSLMSQGLAASVLVTSGVDNVPIKKRADLKKGVQKNVNKVFSNARLHNSDTEQEIFLLLRTIAEQKRKTVNLRHKRPYMLADQVQFESSSSEDVGTLAVTGFVRGECLDVNRLVHIVGWGDYQINRIDAAVNPFSNSKARKEKKNKGQGDGTMAVDGTNSQGDCSIVVEMGNQETLVKHDPSLRQDLVREAEVDPLDAEQTWPTEEEIQEAKEEAMKMRKKLVKKVPDGTSDYQAAWILDSDEEWEEKEDQDDEDSCSEVSMEDVQDLQPVQDADSQVDADEFERPRVSESTMDNTDVQFETASQYDDGMDFEEERLALERYKEERSNQLFPDEVDTPHGIPARTRFQKYRGLRSFRTSPWDVKENLPLDYAKIFQFQNFNRTRKRIRMLDVDETVKPGMYVTVYLENVPKSFVDSHASQLMLYGMFPHEQKMSVMHIALKRTMGPYEDLTIKNKDELLFYVGFRRFRARPLFSQHTNGDKHKMERYLPKDGMCVASVYAQITFPPANALVFKESSSGILPIASGNIFKIDPDRVITKRIVLSGHPFRIHKRVATIRYMFFNPDDVHWFKPVELRTKWGRRGHIKEALGTHGHMKCTFDSQLTSQDTVLMNLYKRVYPKWSYELVNPTTRQKTCFSEAGSVSSYHYAKEVRFDDEFFD